MGDSGKSVLMAMSGGVDSSVAAAMLLQAGYEVTGVFMCLGKSVTADNQSRACCSPNDAADARRVANSLGIDLHVLDMTREFSQIIDYFATEYRNGRTPNPCILCNSRIKFGKLMEKADALGIRYVATGHYARIDHTGPAAIRRAAAAGKDQSYALFAVRRDALERILLPIGELADKSAVRGMAAELGLAVHDKPDSQDICFVDDGDYASLVAKLAPDAMRGGDIVDGAGKVLGQHEGYAKYTIGQRHGLRVAAGVPVYVTAIDPVTATVRVGTRDEVMGSSLRATGANWHCDVSPEFNATVQIRYNHSGSLGRVMLIGEDEFRVDFDSPVSAITPGQAAVVYDGDKLLGGGWIV